MREIKIKKEPDEQVLFLIMKMITSSFKFLIYFKINLTTLIVTNQTNLASIKFIITQKLIKVINLDYTVIGPTDEADLVNVVLAVSKTENIDKIVDTYQYRKEEERYARRISLDEIKSNDYNLNISRYISTSEPEKQIDLLVTNQQLHSIAKQIKQSKDVHNAFLCRNSQTMVA